MRPLLPGDLDQAARALLPLPPADRAAAADRLIAAAGTADRYRKRTGRAHPRWGDGSLMAAALLLGNRTAARWCDDAYCAALTEVLAAWMRHRAAHRAR